MINPWCKSEIGRSRPSQQGLNHQTCVVLCACVTVRYGVAVPTLEMSIRYQHNPLPGIPRSPAPPELEAPPSGWFSRRNLLRAGGILVVAAVVAVVAAALLPGNNVFKPEKKAVPSSAGIQTRSISKAAVDPTPNATSISNILDKMASPTPAPNSAAASLVNGQLGVKPPTPGDKAAEDYGEETTDDPDDDYGTDDTVFDPNPNPGFNQIITATWAAWGGSSAQVSTRSHRPALAEHKC